MNRIAITENYMYGSFSSSTYNFGRGDLLTKILSRSIDLDESLGDDCSTPLITAQIGIRANEATNVMVPNNIKRLPLTEEGRPVVMVTARDLVEAFSTEIF